MSTLFCFSWSCEIRNDEIPHVWKIYRDKITPVAILTRGQKRPHEKCKRSKAICVFKLNKTDENIAFYLRNNMKRLLEIKKHAHEMHAQTHTSNWPIRFVTRKIAHPNFETGKCISITKSVVVDLTHTHKTTSLMAHFIVSFARRFSRWPCFFLCAVRYFHHIFPLLFWIVKVSIFTSD